MTDVRTDIQALRGIAVGVVLLDHFKIGPFHQGYLGVDIFFVISGFLITRILVREIDAGTFSFADFYSRRAKRILPAAYAVILLTSIASAWLLDSIEMASLTKQVWGAVTYTINFVLWSQVGYFDVSAGLKPLLHLWSLAVEEQFYILFPMLLVVVPKKLRLPAIAALAVLSFAACLYVASESPTTAFYLLPMRAWELMIGAFGATILSRPRWLFVTFWPSLITIATLTVVGTGMPHPGIDAALTCLATLLIILANNQRAFESHAGRALGKLGDVSYPLYLVHWPIVVFLNNAFGINAASKVYILGAAVSIFLAIGIHLAVEQPCRKLDWQWSRLAAATITFGGLIGAFQTAVQYISDGNRDLAYLRRPNHGLNASCDSHRFRNLSKCRTSERPTTLVWGDSYAMMVASGAQYHLKEGMTQATQSACPPFIAYAPYGSRFANPEGPAKSCMTFNDSVLAFISQNESLQTVVLAASFWQYTVPQFKMFRRAEDGSLSVEASSLDVAKDKLSKLIVRLRAAGKRVIVVEPPPGVSENNLACSERLALSDNDCTESADFFQEFMAPVEDLMETAAAAGAKIVRLSDALCSKKVCRTIMDGVMLYRDSGHLSYSGAKVTFDVLSKQNKLPPPFH